jgi:hypothetical protein
MFETFACTIAMMSFVALIGPVARVLALAPWQAGTAVIVGGIAGGMTLNDLTRQALNEYLHQHA